VTNRGIPCPTGTYSPYTNLYSERQCLPCPAGYVCSSRG
jgi:hypothetical protein